MSQAINLCCFSVRRNICSVLCCWGVPGPHGGAVLQLWGRSRTQTPGPATLGGSLTHSISAPSLCLPRASHSWSLVEQQGFEEGERNPLGDKQIDFIF